MEETIIAIPVFIIGIALIVFSSKYAVEHSALLATALGVSPLIIGVTLVSVGTDISEIFNSIVSCALGHGDIDVGDSVGSDLTQLTLVFGILPLIFGAFHIHRKDIINSRYINVNTQNAPKMRVLEFDGIYIESLLTCAIICI